MNTQSAGFSRREFLKLSGTAFATILLPRSLRNSQANHSGEWPEGAPLGRVTPKRIRLLSRPHPDGIRLDYRYEDDVFQVLRAVVGEGFYPHNHVWIETPDGYAYSSWVQPVRFDLNEPLPDVPREGIYVELSVPFADAHTDPDPQAPIVYRLYYGSTYQVNDRRVAGDGSVWYRINDENGVKMFGQAAHFRPIAQEEFAPLSPDVNDKSVVVSLKQQSLSAYEGKTEVFRTQISSGRNYFGEDGATLGSLTPAGEHPLWSKRASRHMTGGTRENGYDLPGVPWVMYFAANGAALHGTYWHNDFGTPKSAGCINLRPGDAKWLFRWTLPAVPYVPGNITVQWPGGTKVIIQE
jgi:hypothetical protein